MAIGTAKLWTAILPACLLAACGGTSAGDNLTVESVLAPSASGSGGTIGTNVNTILSGTLKSEQFPAQATRTVRGSTTATASTTAYGSLQVIYNAASNSYTLLDSGVSSPSVFLSGDKKEETVAYQRYAATQNGANDTLVLLRPGATNPTFSLSYVSYGLWSQQTTGTTATTTQRAFVYGVQTGYTAMPRTGSVAYNGLVDGYATNGATRYRLASSAGSLLANFATGEVATTMTLNGAIDTGTAAPGTATVGLGTFAGRGTITAGTNLYTGALAGGTYVGSYSGGFYGPNVNETGYAFTLASGADSIAGVLVAKPEPGTVLPTNTPVTTTPTTTTPTTTTPTTTTPTTTTPTTTTPTTTTPTTSTGGTTIIINTGTGTTGTTTTTTPTTTTTAR